MERGTKLVLEQIVTTIASVADTVEKDFVVYYDRLMPCLKYIIANATTDELKMLRGKTIECVSLIGKYIHYLCKHSKLFVGIIYLLNYFHH